MNKVLILLLITTWNSVLLCAEEGKKVEYGYDGIVTDNKLYIKLIGTTATIGPFVKIDDRQYSYKDPEHGVHYIRQDPDGEWHYIWTYIMMKSVLCNLNEWYRQ